MGTDKALLPIDGLPMAERVLRRLQHLTDDVLIISNSPERLAYLGLPVLPDVFPVRGALPGIISALTYAHGDAVAVVACDMAFASPEIFLAEFELLKSGGADAVVPRTESGLEPFHAVYAREACLTAASAAYAAGSMRADSWYGAVKITEFGPGLMGACDPLGVAFVNINTPTEYDEIAGTNESAEEARAGLCLEHDAG